MDVLRAIVLRGNIRNVEGETSPNTAASMLELIPNNKLTSAQPVEFTVEFFTHEMLIRYRVSLDLGLFMEEDYPRKILQEELTINDDLIFRRNEELVFKK